MSKSHLFLAVFIIILASCSQDVSKELLTEYKNAKTIEDNREKKRAVQLVYQKTIKQVQLHENTGKPVPEGVKKLLVLLSLEKLDTLLARIELNPDEVNDEIIGYMMKDISETLPTIDSPKLKNKFVNFLIRYSNFVENTDDKIEIIEEAKKFGNSEELAVVEKKLRNTISDELLRDAKVFAGNAVTQKNPQLNVAAEYKARLAAKYNPKNKSIDKFLSGIYRRNLGTYSGYASTDLEPLLGKQLDPEINKQRILLAVEDVKSRRGKANIKISVWNVSSDPIKVNASDFKVVTTSNDTVTGKLLRGSPYQNLSIDIKTDTSGFVTFTGRSLSKGARNIEKLIFKDRKTGFTSEKMFK
ncbi:MAG: hypothetical protein ACLFQK_09060 [Fibrobacterota bacterium]